VALHRCCDRASEGGLKALQAATAKPQLRTLKCHG